LSTVNCTVVPASTFPARSVDSTETRCTTPSARSAPAGREKKASGSVQVLVPAPVEYVGVAKATPLCQDDPFQKKPSESRQRRTRTALVPRPAASASAVPVIEARLVWKPPFAGCATRDTGGVRSTMNVLWLLAVDAEGTSRLPVAPTGFRPLSRDRVFRR
jgi:hypothetical protein